MVVSLSTKEVEYRGAINEGMEVVWILHLLDEHGFPVQAYTIIYYNNQGINKVVGNPIAHSKMNHVEFHAHYLR